MARRPFIAGNWKLHKTVGETQQLIRDLRQKLSSVRNCDLAVAPPYTALWAASQRLEDSNIALAGQDLFYEESGAFTGTVSGPMLKEAGCSYVLVGHSERRQHFGETLESSHKRMQAALSAGLIPILCVGESLEEREGGITNDVVGKQLDAAVEGLDAETLGRIVIAYEPVWAIGTGKVATPQQAQEVHNFIRESVRGRDIGAGDAVRIQYGGSVKPANAKELLAQPDIDGALVGGASLDAESFAGIVKGLS